MRTAVQAAPLVVLTTAAAQADRAVTARDRRTRGAFTVRAASPADAGDIHGLIVANLAAGRLLPRERREIALHAHRFVVVSDGGRVIACAELAPLSRAVAEVRSLVVGVEARSLGLGRQLVDELIRRAAAAGFEKLCAFTHSAAYFVQMGFSIVPHAWLPEKIEADCRGCAQFRQCGQYAVMLPLARRSHTFVPLASLHG
jgi:amino-acid N-acetyltransferase